mmetsp:Transcript_16047/g.30291  ORF Transcript_16047/g.30291 Transcript_16047/m.30291 type:complete len:122 (-) Transcript_16047:1019-1384(-)
MNNFTGAFATFVVTSGSYLYYVTVVDVKRSIGQNQGTQLLNTIGGSTSPFDFEQHKFPWEPEGNNSSNNPPAPKGEMFCVFINNDDNCGHSKSKQPFHEKLLEIKKLTHFRGKLNSCSCCT